MIEEIGRITAVDGQRITVETEIKTTCNACAANDNCGTGVVARAFSPKTDTFTLFSEQPAEVGQNVKLGIPEQTLLGASAMVYLLPLVVLILSALALSAFFSHELMVVAGSLLSTLTAFYGVRRYLQTHSDDRFQPLVLALLPAPSQSIDIKQIN